MEFLKKKGIGWYIAVAAAIVALVSAIVVLATYKSALPNNYSAVDVSVCLFVGVALEIALTFFPVRFGSLLSLIPYGAAFGLVINKIAPAIADQANGVHYQGGDFGTCVFYAVIILVAVACCIASGFFARTRDGSEKI